MRYWTFDPFKELDNLRREVDRAFAEFSGGRRPWSNSGGYPLINVSETDDNVVVEALMPGVKPESLNITLLGHQMTISGEKPSFAGEEQPKSIHRNERGGGTFTRSFELPAQVNEANVNAEYKNGVLTVTLPKAEEAKPRKVAVNVA